MNRSLIRPASGALLAAVALACAGEAPTSAVLVPDSPSFAFIGNLPRNPFNTVRTAQVEFVEVCKDFVMTSGATPPTASFTANGNAFTLTNGECKEVWIKGGAPENVTVTETAIPGYLTTYKVTSTSGAVIGPTSGLSTTVAPSGLPAVGFLVEFVNTEEFREEGCTLTQGYWKTHSSYGPAPSDPNWSLVGGPDAAFYFSGKSWHELFWTPPAGGNAYIQLAHQYMAAKLNILSGASTTPAVDAAITWAEAFFNNAANTPSTSYTNAEKQVIRGYASTLGSYNEGLIGPGHCQSN
jgi:hypothetical protein